MRQLMLLTAIILMTAGCAADRPRYDRMTEEELQAYNAGKPMHEQVYCYERRKTGSYIKKRFCDTIFDIVSETVTNAQRVLVADPGQ